MSRQRSQLLLTFLLVLLIFSLGSRIADAREEEQSDGENDALLQEVEDALLEQFDFEEIQSGLDDMFPGEKISFQDVVSSMMSGEPGRTTEVFAEFVRDQISYEFMYNRHNLVYILLTALTAAVFSNFAGAFQNKRISEISLRLGISSI